tara:strand:+ start:694 stop:1848 length:1155 start_codon:yes stop_codon:yes gene_type:complete
MNISIIGGLGHIGLPLSCLFQVNDNNVVIIDTNKDNIENVRNGKPNFYEPGLEDILNEALSKGLKITDEIKYLSESEFVIITIGTSSKQEDKNNFNKVVNQVIEKLSVGSKIILRSTIDFGTCQKIINNKLFQEKKLILAYCPERIAEGKALDELQILPQIIGTSTQKDFEIFKDLFDSIGTESISVSFQEAEFIKLFSNVYRYAEFSLINEFSNIAQKNHIDFNKVFQLAKKEYPRLRNAPETGFVGGPCLPKDTKTFINNFQLEDSVINKLEDTNIDYFKNIIKDINSKFSNEIIIFLGITFKPDSDDLRGSISYNLSKELIESGNELYIIEPNINEKNIPEKIYKYEEVKNLTENVIIGTSHTEFRDYDFEGKKVIQIGNN